MRMIGRIAVAMLVATAAASGSAAQAPNTLTAAQRKAGWQLLFDGTSAGQWRGYRSDSIPAGWRVENGTLTKSGSAGDLITRQPYRDFELDLDWKIGPAGNSGIFYRATEEYDEVYWSGPEYQLLDDAAAPDGGNRLTSAGAAYAIYPSPAGIVKPAGDWNTTRIIVHGQHVEHWLNGTRLLAYDLGSPDWTARVAGSKFAPWHDYGRASMGYIGIQGDHNGALSLRNIRILPR
jgi:3-keto-disaccharide hydrolase